MVVGDRKTQQMHIGEGRPITKSGRVVYIHPRRRFYVLEFEFEKGNVREAYLFNGGTEICRQPRH